MAMLFARTWVPVPPMTDYPNTKICVMGPNKLAQSYQAHMQSTQQETLLKSTSRGLQQALTFCVLMYCVNATIKLWNAA